MKIQMVLDLTDSATGGSTSFVYATSSGAQTKLREGDSIVRTDERISFWRKDKRLYIRSGGILHQEMKQRYGRAVFDTLVGHIAAALNLQIRQDEHSYNKQTCTLTRT